jgi:hypothetical protein
VVNQRPTRVPVYGIMNVGFGPAFELRKKGQ